MKVLIQKSNGNTSVRTEDADDISVLLARLEEDTAEQEEENQDITNLKEDEYEYTLTLGFPGLDGNDINVEVDGSNVLRVSAAVEEEETGISSDEESEEYFYSSFERSFRFPDNALVNETEAYYEDNVLTLIVPKGNSSEN